MTYTPDYTAADATAAVGDGTAQFIGAIAPYAGLIILGVLVVAVIGVWRKYRR